MEGKVTNNRMSWYGHILRISKKGIPKKVLNFKVKAHDQE
jgi:hypothetical protein